MTKEILILPGDGIGQEVTGSAKEILNFFNC
jgi:isocitrate/isopropylmalate dehydrogenase